MYKEWNLFNYHREGVKKEFYKTEYHGKNHLTVEEIILPEKACIGHNLLYDLSKLGKVVTELPKNSIKIVGLAYLLEESKSRIELDQLVKERIFTNGMIYPKIIQAIPKLRLPTTAGLYYIELKGWKNRKSTWTTEWDLVTNIHSKLRV